MGGGLSGQKAEPVSLDTFEKQTLPVFTSFS
jgi:hypothetical protein